VPTRIVATISELIGAFAINARNAGVPCLFHLLTAAVRFITWDGRIEKR
jgi:hypothetical protein